MKRAIIFDLDGTLALIDHRRHYVTCPVLTADNPDALDWEPNWDAFYEACDNDAPNPAVVALYKHLLSHSDPDSGQRIFIFSGRSASVKRKTLKWFDNHGIPWPDRLLMRDDGDFTPDEQLKEQWLRNLQGEGYFVIMTFDDRQKVVDMWRRNGITCLQVAPGDF
jgi:hypothetical protein